MDAPIVLVDLDGPVVDLEKAVADAMEQTPWHIPVSQRIGFEVAKDYLARFGTEAEAAVKAVMSTPGLYSIPPIVPGAAEGLTALAKTEFRVFLCTAPLLWNPTCASDKLSWVQQHLGDPWQRRVIIAKDKTLVRGHLLIDDKETIVGELEPMWRQVLFATPSNRGAQIPRYRVWEDPVGVVRSQLAALAA